MPNSFNPHWAHPFCVIHMSVINPLLNITAQSFPYMYMHLAHNIHIIPAMPMAPAVQRRSHEFDTSVCIKPDEPGTPEG